MDTVVLSKHYSSRLQIWYASEHLWQQMNCFAMFLIVVFIIVILVNVLLVFGRSMGRFDKYDQTYT